MKAIKFSLLLLLGFSTLFSCTEHLSGETKVRATSEKEAMKSPEKVQVLNFGSFHMGFTTDAHTTEFDENDKKNQEAVHKIAQKLATFNPTVIVVEIPPRYNEKLQAEYKEYVSNPDMFFKNPSEIELLAYELGRISGAEKIYGIDHKLNYNYGIGHQIENAIDTAWYNQFYQNPFQYFPGIVADESQLSLMEKLVQTNKDEYLNLLMAANADMLTHAGTDDNFEGADEAAKFYQRNLRMYSNLNRLSLTKEDRVFILMGAGHTAFFRDFMSRSPKYEMVNTFEYLK